MEHTTSEKLISVIIPAHNTAQYIARAIRSVLAQTYRNFEIIVVDDCSSDNLAEVVAQFNDQRINYIRHEINRGASTARNTGLKIAKGEYVAFLDSDDEWFADKLQKQVDVFNKSHLNTGLVYTGLRWIQESDKTVIQEKIPNHRGNIHQDLLNGSCIESLSTPLIKTVVAREAGDFDESLPARQDWDFWIRISEKSTIDFVPEVLVNYFIHPNSISSSIINKIKGTELVLEKYHDDFGADPHLLLGHYQLLTILHMLNGDLKKSRSYNLKTLKLGIRTIGVYRKFAIHFILSFAGKTLRGIFFRLMKLKNKDFFWVLGSE